ncbi:HCL052Wp [Eremothecium sinecaudum]|uniref:HCL052Wp n=1 Tax=Eremothecium sinecaudum TaxID=45286 RepID=A0A0X8HRH0_9SACH|nr:HCL052Wp [Eremothecium sinecaudum]AMD20099.1 HCL052Wp [Eremothecium sinecaudum]
MLEYEAIIRFTSKPVNMDMINFLAATTASTIQIKHGSGKKPVVPLVDYIVKLVRGSNVQTPTLMATTVYLSKLKNIIPAHAHGMETTRHRIFTGCLVLASKYLNDSSPLNKHWCEYTNDLLDLAEMNMIERELLAYLNWEINITTEDLVACLSHFLNPIKEELAAQLCPLPPAEDLLFRQHKTGYMHSDMYSLESPRTYSSGITESNCYSGSISMNSKFSSPRTPVTFSSGIIMDKIRDCIPN